MASNLLDEAFSLKYNNNDKAAETSSHQTWFTMCDVTAYALNRFTNNGTNST
jgi:hypothetical protein